ncbi:MAG TPA: hypothetical protein VN224_04280, partial [Xanthomonadales bacterium]|nr:hypothetical protein [Xanthomonadales bacterium]
LATLAIPTVSIADTYQGSNYPAAGYVDQSVTTMLTCQVSSSDFPPLLVTNTSAFTFPKGTKIFWSFGSHKGRQALSADLKPGVVVHVRNPLGSGNSCTAWVYQNGGYTN